MARPSYYGLSRPAAGVRRSFRPASESVYTKLVSILQVSEEIDRIVDFPDDAAAILGAHRVEHALAAYLRQHVQYDRNVYRTMFEAAGPLESFEAKINIAFLFGLVDRTALKKLQIISRIASRFSDNFRGTSFSSKPMQDLVAKLSSDTDRRSARNRTGADSTTATSAKAQYVRACLQLALTVSGTAGRSSSPLR